MAHNLATIDGAVAMAYQGAAPWHHLGTRFDGGHDLNAVLQAAHLDWTVHLEKLFLQDHREVPNRRAVVRDTDAEILATVSAWYAPIQNRDAFEVFVPAMQEFGLTIEAAGALGKGERAWMLFKLPTTLTPIAGDTVHGYGVAVTGHDGTTAYEFRPTPIRVVCQNTLTLAIGAGGAKGRVFSIPHIGNVQAQIAQVSALVKHATAAMVETGETFARLAARQMTPDEVIAFIESVFPTPKDGTVSPQLADRRATVGQLVWTGVGAELAGSNAEGTSAWAAYNAVTEYFDHVVTGKAKTANARRIANTSALFGHGADVKALALTKARELVAA